MNITEFRSQHPEYNDMSDVQLTQALHNKFYSDMPYESFSQKFGVSSEKKSGLGDTLKDVAKTGIAAALVPFSPALAADLIPNNVKTGFKQGIKRFAQGPKQLALEAGEKLDLVPQGSARDYQKQVDTEYNQYKATPEGQSTSGAIAEFVGQSAPYFLPGGMLLRGVKAAPVAAAGLKGLLANMAGNAATGATIGGLQYVPEGGSRTFNAVTGGLLNSSVPLALQGVAKGASLFRKAPAVVANEALRGVDPQKAYKGLRAANKLDPEFTLTPAEASGSPIAAGTQGKLGTSRKGALALQTFGQKRQGTEEKIITGLLDDISPNNASAATDIRRAAKRVFTREDQALQKAAQPLYEKARQAVIPDESLQGLMQDDVIAAATKNVTKVPAYAKDLKNTPVNSIKYLDYVKRNIDDQIATAKHTGDNNLARLLVGSKKKLVTTLDNFSDDYKAARVLYGEGAEPLKALKESPLGRIAKLKDAQLKTVSRTIFDPSQTDPKVLSSLRDKISKENPEAWRRIIRNHIESSLDTKVSNAAGSTFYKSVIGNDRKFNQLLVATKGMPDVRRKLIYMKRAFGDLINPLSVKGAAGRSAASTLTYGNRDTKEAIKIAISNMLGGKYDQAMIKLITSNKWDKEFGAIQKLTDNKLRAQRAFDLVGKISALSAVESSNDVFDESTRK
jgi:hypothetical protein